MTIAYDTVGDQGHPAVVLIAGLGRQLIDWDGGFCSLLAATGLLVIRIDNRDVGLSDRIPGGKVDLRRLAAQKAAGRALDVPYRLTDMAGDVTMVLDDLDVRRAHIIGMSMGGRIAQLGAIGAAERVRTLTSIASSTGAQGVGLATKFWSGSCGCWSGRPGLTACKR